METSKDFYRHNQSKNELWQNWENDVALALNGQRVRCSGRFDLFKGDVIADRYLVDCKHTEKPYYTLDIKTWQNVSEWARNAAKTPVLALRIDDGSYKAAEFIVIPEIDYCELTGKNGLYDLIKGQRSKKIGKMIEPPVFFAMQRERLVVMAFDEFVREISENIQKQQSI